MNYYGKFVVPADPILTVNDRGLVDKVDTKENTKSIKLKGFKPENDDSTQNTNNYEHQQKLSKFWKIIEQLKWVNASCYEMDVYEVRRKLVKQDQDLFREMYKFLFCEMYQILNKEGVIKRCGLENRELSYVISHAIGLGEKQYETLSKDMSFYEYLINAKECQAISLAM